MLVGKDCGKKIYGADFSAIEKDFDTARDRADLLHQRRAALDAAPAFLAALEALRSHPAVSEFSELRRSFIKSMTGLSNLLANAIARGGGALFIEERVRDFEAEGRREEEQERKQATLATMTKTQAKKLRRDGDMPGSVRKQKPIYKLIPRQIGTISGQPFFRLLEPPATVLEALDKRARSALVTLQSQAMTTAQLRSFFRALNEVIDSLLAAIDRLASPRDAFEAGNLKVIAQWASSSFKNGERFEAGIGMMSRYDRDMHLLATCRCPPRFTVPSRSHIEAFRSALNHRRAR